MKKIAVAVALWLAVGASHAAFVDNRKIDAVIEVNYKSITVEDLVDDIVPGDIQINYAKPDLRKKMLKISGKGTWQQLLTQATVPGNVLVQVDVPGRRVQISERAVLVATGTPSSAAAPAATSPAAVASITAAKPVNTTAAATAGNAVITVVSKPVQTWSVTIADRSVRTLLERWAKTASYQMSWEIPVDLELNANANMTGSFEDALTALLASLKNSEYPIEAIIYDNNVVRMVKRSPRNK